MMTLHGLRILNTRPCGQSEQLSEKIRTSGGISWELPTLFIQPTLPTWVHRLLPLDAIDIAIFISPNAVSFCFQQLQKQNLVWPSHIKVFPIGQATAAQLKAWGVPITALPPVPDSEHLLKLPPLQSVESLTVALFKGKGGRRLIETNLKARGARVLSFSIYQRSLPCVDPNYIRELWTENKVDVVLLTSGQSLHHLFKIFSKEIHPWLKKKNFLVISNRLAKLAKDHGIKKNFY